MAEILTGHLGAGKLGRVFPGHAVKKKNFKHFI
jgi:hypothetical protein